MSDAFFSGGADYLGVVLDVGFYGLHVGLYLFFLGVHYHIGAKPFRGVANIASSITFALGTVYVALHITTTYFEVTGQLQDDAQFALVNKIGNAASTIFTFIDFISQMLLVYRCWIIWDKRYLVAILPTLLALTSLWSGWSVIILVNTRAFTDSLDNVLGALAVVSISSALAVNGIVTLTIVSRIWYISRRFQQDLNTSSHRQAARNPYSIIIAMLLESGATVVAAQLISVILYQIDDGGYAVITGASTQIYAFTPTIILIRVALGKSYDRDTKMSTVAFNHQSVKSATTVGDDVMTFGNETKSGQSGRGGEDPEKFASE